MINKNNPPTTLPAIAAPFGLAWLAFGISVSRSEYTVLVIRLVFPGVVEDLPLSTQASAFQVDSLAGEQGGYGNASNALVML